MMPFTAAKLGAVQGSAIVVERWGAESTMGRGNDSDYGRVFSVSTVAGIVPILPRVSSPTNASAATRDAKPLDAGGE
jgi:hypothetical protein